MDTTGRKRSFSLRPPPVRPKYSATPTLTPIGDNDEIIDVFGQSKFVLKELPRYTIHPNLARYYEPMKPTALQKFLTENEKTRSFMLKVTEYDQDKTLLILTNNPFPCPFYQHGTDITPITPFSEEFQRTRRDRDAKRTEKLSLKKIPATKASRAERKSFFPMIHLEELTSSRKQWFRFSTEKDFLSEGKYSQLHALRKQKKMYPQLSFATATGSGVTKKSQSDTPIYMRHREPLTLATLLKEQPIRVAPGENTFRFGRATQWVIKNATAIQ